FYFQAEDGIRDDLVTGVQTCALPIFPIFHWDMMRRRNFDWWRQRVRSIRRSFHLFRIDHVLGFYRIYAFPWRPRRNKKFLPLEWDQMLERTGGRAPHFHPRDDSTPDNCEANQKEGENYLRAVLEESGEARVIGGELEKIATFTGFTRTSEQIDFERDFYPAMMEGLLQSESWIAIVMITDLLARKYRFNIPGTTASSNWVRRMQRSVSQLRSSPKE